MLKLRIGLKINDWPKWIKLTYIDFVCFKFQIFFFLQKGKMKIISTCIGTKYTENFQRRSNKTNEIYWKYSEKIQQKQRTIIQKFKRDPIRPKNNNEEIQRRSNKIKETMMQIIKENQINTNIYIEVYNLTDNIPSFPICFYT